MYPSYPKDPEPGQQSLVLIASYCRTQDAERLGALIHPDGTAEPELINLIFRGLAAVHSVEVKDIKRYYREGDYFAWDWIHDPLAMGGCSLPITAFAPLNGHDRRECILWSRCIWERGYLWSNASAGGSRKTFLRWRGDERLQRVRGLILPTSCVVLTQTLPTAGLREL